MLRLNDEAFTIGASRFDDRSPADEEGSAKIFVKIVPQNLGAPILAQLDTGAAWSVLEPEIAETIGLFDADGTPPQRLLTRFGPKEGALVRTPIVIPADDGLGDSIALEVTVFACRDWPSGRNFIGYSGFLDGIRIGLDPQRNLFFFGRG